MPSRDLCYEDVWGGWSQPRYEGQRALNRFITEIGPQVLRSELETITLDEEDFAGSDKRKTFTLVRPDIADQAEALESVFRSLSQTWKAETMMSSSLTNVAMHPAYQRII